MESRIARSTELESIDPEFAWSEFEPSDAQPWDRRRASHLYRRAAFGAKELEVEEIAKLGAHSALDRLFQSSDRSESFENESNGLAEALLATGDPRNLSRWWLHRMMHSPNPLVEKMTLFWHGHFATGAEKVGDIQLMHEQNQLLRSHALGDFRAMVHGVSKDPAMLIYLDSVTNRKAHANENYARELMELFCLGEGNYSEADVQQLARCFTGWEIRRKQFRFNSYQHDFGKKTLLGASAIESGEEAIDRVLAQPSLPYFIARKLFRFFVADEPTPSDRFLAPLANTLTEGRLNLNRMVRKMLGSRLLLSDWSVGRKVRSPVELAIGFLAVLEGSTNLDALSNRLREIGQAVFFPPNVKGWDGGRTWVNSSTLVGRANLVHQLVRDESSRFAQKPLTEFVRMRAADWEQFLTWFEGLYLAVPLSETQRKQIRSAMDSTQGDHRVRTLLSVVATLPQFQLC